MIGTDLSFRELAEMRRSGTKLFPAHLEELRASGLDDATIAAAGVYSESDQRKINHLLNRKRPLKKPGSCMVYPYHGPDGANGYFRVKPDRPRKNDGKLVKYESPVGRENQPYFPPGTLAAVDNTEILLLISEGEKKSLCADQNGLACIGLVGVWGWKPKKNECLIAGLERVKWKGRKVYIAFDSDRDDKPDVAAAESRLAAVLTRYGATVRCIRLPGEPDGTKNGLDDYIVRYGANALHRLIAEAVEPPEVDGEDTDRPANAIDPRDEIAKMLASVEQDGVPRLRYWRGTYLWWNKGRYVEQDVDEVQSQIVAYLNPTVTGLNTGVVSNMVMQLRAQGRISPASEPPAWLGDKSWEPSEILACKNELVHLPSYVGGKTEYKQPATPRYFCTSASGFDFDASAPAPVRWQRFLSELWRDDADSIELLREWFGYILVPDTSLQKIMLMLGPRRAGKGTIARILASLIGTENVQWPSMTTLGRPFGLEKLVGKSLAVVGDAKVAGRDEAVTASARLVGISGEDPQEVDRKGRPSITCRLPCRLIVATNEIPKLPDPSGALEARYSILRFTESFVGREDRELENELKKELPGILLWAITGWRRLRERGRFQEPAAAAEIHEQAADIGSPVGRFVREKCLVRSEAAIVREDLYAVFKDWCKEIGREHVPDNGEFGRLLRAAVPNLKTPPNPRHVKGHDHKKRVYEGIELAPVAF